MTDMIGFYTDITGADAANIMYFLNIMIWLEYFNQICQKYYFFLGNTLQ